MPTKKMTPATQARYAEMVREVSQTLADFRHPALVKSILPTEWREIGVEVIPDKTRITLRVDADVAKFYRKLGRDYQATMNRVLRAFMLARLTEMLGKAEVFELAETDDLGAAELEMEVMLRDQLDELRRGRLAR